MHLPQRSFAFASVFLLTTVALLLPSVSAREAAVDLTFSVSKQLPNSANLKSKSDFNPYVIYSKDIPTEDLACSIEGEMRFDPLTTMPQSCLNFNNLGLNSKPKLYWSFPIQKDSLLRNSVNYLLGGYFRDFSSLNEQTSYEERITTNLEFGAFVSALVRMDQRDFPGYADEISNTITLKQAISPWAAQIAAHRSLPQDSFASISNGILYSLGKSGDATQSRFAELLKKSDSLLVYANQVDAAYQLTSVFPSEAKNIERYTFIDSLVVKSDLMAKEEYLNMAIRNAIRIHPEMQSELEAGKSVVQILKSRNSKITTVATKAVKAKVPTKSLNK